MALSGNRGAVASSPDVGPSSTERPWNEDEERALRVWITLARAYMSFSRVMAGKVSEYGLTTPQFGVLEALHHLGPLSLGELADKLLVTGGNVTYVMDRLEEQGLVRRQRSETDRRVILARLTPEGSRLVSGVFPGHAAFVADLCSELEPDEQDELRRLLKKLGKGVQARGAELRDPGADASG
ncbi:MAG: MarR family transcriptional regulator [Gemmatimonadetes bacterium]|nr:MarR family transcriptional regulator [Gemmatimonadota bacterium]